jgi:phenylalanyl-tRNA synthetase beta chain
MKISTRWVRSLTGLEAAPEEIASRLTGAGVEVESMQKVGTGLDRVVVATVTAKRPHPSRDRLTIVALDDGAGGREVVCGAPNVPEPGRQVALADVGARVRGTTVETRAIAGVESRGMIASEVEIDVGGDADGILVLDEGKPFAPGTPAADALATEDTILDLSLTPNRADCLGHHGVAREVSALFGRTFQPPDPDTPPRIAAARIETFAAVTVQDAERCPRYGAAVVVDLTVRPSPFWLRYRLHTLGIRAISNLVDVTNLVLLEYGQPLHAFDLDRLRGAQIVVRRARAGETMATLDGVARTFTDDDLLICDGEGPVAVAGVMGGERSGVGPETKKVLLECAYFSPRGIRRAARRLGLHTESSHRFERGTDPEGVPDALAHAASLLSRLGGGAAAPGAIDLYPAPIPPKRVVLRASRASTLSGTPIARDEAEAILGRLGCAVTPLAGDDELDVVCPPFRPDLASEVDLIEEVVRVRGMDSVPTTYPAIRTGPATPRRYDRLRPIRTGLRALGLHEAISFSFVAPRELDAVHAPAAQRVPLQNPLSEDRSVLRTTLLVGLLAAAGRARRARVPDVRLFELGRVFVADPALLPLVHEPAHAAVLLVGERSAWLAAGAPYDVWDAKGVLEALVRERTGRSPDLVAHPPERLPFLHPRSPFEVRFGDQSLGWLGEIHPDVLGALDVEGPAVGFEIDADRLSAPAAEGRRGVVPPPRFPPVERDVAAVLPDEITAGAAMDLLREVAGPLLESVVPFDLYRGDPVPAGHRSLALRLTYRAADRTLTEAEVDAVHERARDALGRRLGAKIR